MTAFGSVAESSGPGAAAEIAAEAVRTVNRLTIAAPSPGVPDWKDVADLYRVLGEIRILVERLPQALDQLARHLERPVGYRSDGGTKATPDELVASAVGALGAARTWLTHAGHELTEAHSAASHLAPRVDDGW